MESRRHQKETPLYSDDHCPVQTSALPFLYRSLMAQNFRSISRTQALQAHCSVILTCFPATLSPKRLCLLSTYHRILQHPSLFSFLPSQIPHLKKWQRAVLKVSKSSIKSPALLQLHFLLLWHTVITSPSRIILTRRRLLPLPRHRRLLHCRRKPYNVARRTY